MEMGENEPLVYQQAVSGPIAKKPSRLFMVISIFAVTFIITTALLLSFMGGLKSRTGLATDSPSVSEGSNNNDKTTITDQNPNLKYSAESLKTFTKKEFNIPVTFWPLAGFVALIILGFITGPMLSKRYRRELELVYFFVPTFTKGPILPCKVIVKNNTSSSLKNVQVMVLVKDFTGNILTRVRPPLLKISEGEEMISIPLDSKSFAKGDYLFELIIKYGDKQVRGLCHGKLI